MKTSLLIDGVSEKQCFKCGEIKPLSEYYRHPQMGDGHLNKCKVCTRRDVQVDREHRRGRWRRYDALRYANGRRPPPRDPVKARTQKAVENAVRRGHLVKPDTCTDCGAQFDEPRRIEAHHKDYSKPLDVVWVCKICHGKRHRMEAPVAANT